MFCVISQINFEKECLNNNFIKKYAICDGYSSHRARKSSSKRMLY